MRLTCLAMTAVLAAAAPALAAESTPAAPTTDQRALVLGAELRLAIERRDALNILAKTDALRRLSYLPPTAFLMEARAANAVDQPLFAKYLYDEYLLRAHPGDQGFAAATAERNDLLTEAEAELKKERDAAVKDGGTKGKITTPHTDPGTPPIQPEYPADARAAGQSGRVVMELFVGRNGRVYEGRIKTSSGSERLDKFALNTALTAWHFAPGTVDGNPAPMWMPFAARFEAESPPPPPTGEKRK